MPGLAGHEGDGVAGPEGGTQHLAGAAIEAGGQIDGEHGNIGVGDAADQGAHIGRHRATKPRPEQAIDDDVAGFGPIEVEFLSLQCAADAGAGGIALQPHGIAEVEERHPRPALLQMTCCDIGVAAIVAGSAKRDEAQRSGMKAQSRGRNRGACPFHQGEGIDAGCGSGRIDGGHFGRREKKVGQVFDHHPIQSKNAQKTTAWNTKEKNDI